MSDIRFGRIYDFQLGEASKGGIRVRSLDGYANSLRVDFEVTRNDSKHPNVATIDIFGLNRDNLKSLSGLTSLPCLISVGHVQTDLQQIFLGEMRRSFVKREERDIILHADAGDSTTALREAKISKSYPKGTKMKKILDDTVNTFDVDGYEDLTDGAVEGELPRGISIQAPAGEVMDNLVRPKGCIWYCDSGKIVVAKQDSKGQASNVKITALFEPAAVMLKKDPNSKTQRKIVAFRTLLDPRLFPGAQFELSDPLSEYNGKCKCVSVKHRGSSRENVWESEVEAVAVS